MGPDDICSLMRGAWRRRAQPGLRPRCFRFTACMGRREGGRLKEGCFLDIRRQKLSNYFYSEALCKHLILPWFDSLILMNYDLHVKTRTEAAVLFERNWLWRCRLNRSLGVLIFNLRLVCNTTAASWQLRRGGSWARLQREDSLDSKFSQKKHLWPLLFPTLLNVDFY